VAERLDWLPSDAATVGRSTSLHHEVITEALPTMLATVGDVRSIVLAEISAVPRMQTRLRYPQSASRLLDVVKKVRATSGIPFWDAVLLAIGDEQASVRDDVLSTAQLHQPTAQASTREFLDVESSLREALVDRASRVRTGALLVVSSFVETISGGGAHLPMLDFRVPPTPSNLELVGALVRTLQLKGWILESGRSYHFYGSSLLSYNEFRTFLGRALLFQPVVDARWVAHQVIEGAAALRISRGGQSQITPKIVAAIS
jgi:hypothetical protein